MYSEKTHINILVTIDRNYLYPLSMMLSSYRNTNAGIETDVYVAHSSLEENDFTFLESMAEHADIHIHSVKITEHWFSDTPVLERLPEESFYRLLAFHYLPDSVERCLYLDPDIIILKSLQPFYTQDLKECYIAAAGHMHGFRDVFNKKRLGIKKQERYINSGVMLMNLAAIRSDFTLEKIFECMEENVQRLLLGDQDMVNLLFGQKTLFVDERIYNLDERTYRYFHKHEHLDIDTVTREAVIVHYNGKYKPWLEGYKGVLDVFYPKIENKGAAPAGTKKKLVKSFFSITKPTKQQATALAGVIMFIFICLFSYLFFGKELIKIVSEPTLFRAWLDKFGAFDELIFILIRAAQTVVKFIPAEPLEIGSGYAWGTVPGMLYCIIGNMIGTIIILALTKRFGQKVINLFMPVKKMESLSLFQSSEKIYVLLFFLYLIPGSPKDGFTYFVGLLPIKIVPFMIITGIARIPSVLSSTLCGSALAEKQYWISILIFAATVVLAILGGLLYRAFVKKKGRKP